MINIPEKDKDFSKLFHVFIDSGAWAGLSFKAKAVYVALLRFAGYEHRTACPTIPKLAQLAGVSEDSVSEAIKQLAGRGFIDVKRGGYKFGFRNIYRLPKSPQSETAWYKKPRSPTKHRAQTARDPGSGKFYSLKDSDASREKAVKCVEKRLENIQKTEKTVEGIRGKSVNGILRENTGDKENREIKNIRDSGLVESSAGSKSQASPRLTKSIYEVNKDTLIQLRNIKGDQGFTDVLVKSGYDREEVEAFLRKNLQVLTSSKEKG